MEKSFEKIYSAGELEREAEKVASAVEIPKKDWQTLEIIAKRVGGDFGMEIKLGKPGGGSFFNPEDGSITFDPLHIRDNIEQSKFIAGHEGSHRAITPSPKEIGLSREQIQENYSQIGFGYLQNVIEDPAANDWMTKRFPGLEPYTAKIYDEQFKKENAVLSNSEVQKIAAQLGYWPKFSQYGSEVIRDWHQKRFSRKLDPAVEKTLKRTIGLARESIGIIPDPQKPSRDKKEIIIAGQKRFENNTNYIWPEVKKLVEMDLHTEEQKQMLNEQDLFNQLPEDAKKELQEQIDKAIRETAERLNKEIEEKQKQAQEAGQKQEELKKEIQELEEKAKSASGKEKEDLEKQIEKKKAEKLEQEMKQKQAEQAEQDLQEIQDALDKIQSGEEGGPYPEDKLSEKTKKEIEKLFKNLPSQKQKDLRDKAEKQLEDFEDAINKEIGGKLNEDKQESHKEYREREKREKESADKRTKTEEEKKELEKKLEQMRREKMTEYDKTYEETADIINSLYNRLKKFFLPERHPKWKKDYPTGSRLDLEKAMQAEADPRYLEKLWERKTIPHKLDYRFSVLVDLSGSMKGEKIEETFKGVVALAEVLEKLGMQYEVIGFSSGVKSFKEWREKLNKEKRNELVELKSWGKQKTHTDEATEFAIEHIAKNRGKNNFILTLTDGQPYPEGHGERLRETLKEAKNKNIKTVGCGLGPNTEFVKDYYPASLSIPNVKPTEQQKKEGQKDFTEAFADLLEDMIRHPEKY